jgi:hypothetical protein
MFERLILLLHIKEVPGSNLCPETDYPDRKFYGFPHSLQTSTLNWAMTASFHIFPIHHSPIIFQLMVYSLSYTEKATLSKI